MGCTFNLLNTAGVRWSIYRGILVEPFRTFDDAPVPYMLWQNKTTAGAPVPCMACVVSFCNLPPGV